VTDKAARSVSEYMTARRVTDTWVPPVGGDAVGYSLALGGWAEMGKSA
jgi:hypothetical protein